MSLWRLQYLTSVDVHTDTVKISTKKCQNRKGEQQWWVPHVAVVDPSSPALLGSMDFKPLSRVCQESALVVRLEIFRWLGKKIKDLGGWRE